MLLALFQVKDNNCWLVLLYFLLLMSWSSISCLTCCLTNGHWFSNYVLNVLKAKRDKFKQSGKERPDIEVLWQVGYGLGKGYVYECYMYNFIYEITNWNKLASLTHVQLLPRADLCLTQSRNTQKNYNASKLRIDGWINCINNDHFKTRKRN